MSFALLEKQVSTLPVELQNSIEMYALFVINTFNQTSKKTEKKLSASAVLDKLTGIISTSVPLSIKDIRDERLSGKYGV